jgi:hypothetical protein
MTQEEQYIYNNLSSSNKEYYDFILKQHPTWTHDKIMIKIGVDDKIGDMLDGEGAVNINIENEQVQKEILQGAKHFLLSIGCVAGGIISIIDNVLDLLSNIIDGTIDYVGDKLKKFWNWLNN